MALPSTAKVYVSSGGGFGPAPASELVSAGISAPTASARGGVLLGSAVANCTVAADGTSAGTQLNLLLAQLRTAGIIAP